MLDKRIKAGKTPLTVFSSDIKNFLHKSGYFADSPYDFEVNVSGEFKPFGVLA